jgi:ATP-binding cassette subfamily B protein
MADPHGVYARFHRVQCNKGLGLVDDSTPIQTPAQDTWVKKMVGGNI